MRSIELKTNNYEKYELAFIDMNQYGTSTPAAASAAATIAAMTVHLISRMVAPHATPHGVKLRSANTLALFEMLNSLSGTSSSTYIKWTDRQTTNGN